MSIGSMGHREMKWALRFMDIAMTVSTWSKDTSSKVGVVVIGENNRVLTWGYNGLPRGCDDDPKVNPHRHESGKPEKYRWYEHAERNAVYNAAADGVALKGSTMFAPNAACCDCARAVVQAGISRFVYFNDGPFFDRPDWVESLQTALTIFQEGGVELIAMPGFPKSE